MARDVGQEQAPAQQIGRQLADRFMPDGIRPKPSDLTAQLGVEIVVLPSPPPAQPGLRSEYTGRPCRITLYAGTIGALEARGERPEARLDFVELHIAHELFHHLEACERLAPLTRAESEVAAHAFARELMGLESAAEEPDEAAS